MEIIVPCAGHSSRFPGMRPKFLLTDYSGRFMFQRAIGNLHESYSVYVVILREHEQEFKVSNILNSIYGSRVKLVVLDERTSGPAETVFRALDEIRVSSDSSVLVRDCDSFFDSKIEEGNFVFTSSLKSNPNIANVTQKSFLSINNQGIVNSIVEKQIISDVFCVGGYQFEKSGHFREAFESLKNKSHSAEIYLSDVVDVLISQGHIFISKEVSNYVDVGTAKEWYVYNNKPTYFCDIDGTIIRSHLHPAFSREPLVRNVQFLIQEQSRGCQIVFVTSRMESLRLLTEELLNSLGFSGYTLLMGIHHSKRILINDFAITNPYPSALAINIQRDEDSLAQYIGPDYL